LARVNSSCISRHFPAGRVLGQARRGLEAGSWAGSRLARCSKWGHKGAKLVHPSIESEGPGPTYHSPPIIICETLCIVEIRSYLLSVWIGLRLDGVGQPRRSRSRPMICGLQLPWGKHVIRSAKGPAHQAGLFVSRRTGCRLTWKWLLPTARRLLTGIFKTPAEETTSARQVHQYGRA
jgi:hypothetical protein